MPSLNTGNAILSNAITVDGSYNVGIGGAASGSYKLQVSGTTNLTGALTVGTNLTVGNVLYGNSAQFSNSLTGSAYFLNGMTAGSGALYWTSDIVSLANNNTGGSLNFITNATEKMRITSAGNVGIGTSSPSAKLEITNGRVLLNNGYSYQFYNTAGTAVDTLQMFTDGNVYLDAKDNTGGNIIFRTTNSLNERMRITSGGYLKLNQSRILGDSDICYMDLYNPYTGNLSIVNTSTNANFGNIIFSTSNTERMRITSGGLVGIANSSISAVRLAVSYGGGGSIAVGIGVQDVDNATNAQYMQFLNAATTAIGSISRNGGLNQINYNTSSDYRLKEDFKDFNGLEKVTAIKVYDHKWVGFEDRTTSVIAHELAEILPYAVTGEKDAVDENGNIKPQQVDYSKIVPVLVKAIQEQQAMIEAQQQQINQLINK